MKNIIEIIQGFIKYISEYCKHDFVEKCGYIPRGMWLRLASWEECTKCVKKEKIKFNES